ncbi:hypothetical protein ES703_57317 [subsurface metagenome]
MLADKNKIYIPMDRLGVESVQSNTMGTIKFIEFRGQVSTFDITCP